MHGFLSDPALPRLQDLFPVAGVTSVVAEMAREAFGTLTQPENGKVSYVRYHPTRSCDVLWSFPGPLRRPLLVSGRLLSHGGDAITSRPSFQRSAEIVRAASEGKGCPYRYLPDWQLLLQIFPLDMKLPGLAFAGSPAWLRETFCELLGSDKVHVVESMPVQYKPWRRCVLRCVVDDQDRRLQYFAKVFSDDRGAAMVERLRAIRAQLHGPGVPLDVVVPVAYVDEAQMLMLAASEDSEELSPLVRKAVHDSEARTMLLAQLARVAEWLVAFQRIVIDGVPRVGPHDVLKEHERDLQGILRTAPSLGQSIQMYLSALEAAAVWLPPEETVLCHGAFRHNQFLRCGNTLVVLDLDAVSVSGCSADAAEFLAYLDATALRRSHLRPVVSDCQRVFTAALLQHRRMDQRWLAWHRAASHLKWAQRTFLSLDPRWPELTAGLLQLAERTLAGLAA